MSLWAVAFYLFLPCRILIIGFGTCVLLLLTHDYKVAAAAPVFASASQTQEW